MPPHRNSSKVTDAAEIRNRLRHERQKTIEMVEMARLTRQQVEDAIEDNKRIVEKSKKLCAPPRKRSE